MPDTVFVLLRGGGNINAAALIYMNTSVNVYPARDQNTAAYTWQD